MLTGLSDWSHQCLSSQRRNVVRVRRGTSEGIAGSRRIACVKHGGGFAVLGRWLSQLPLKQKKPMIPLMGWLHWINHVSYCWLSMVFFPLPSDKRLQKTNWKDPPFYSWVNQLFRLGHFPVRKLLVYQRVYSMISHHDVHSGMTIDPIDPIWRRNSDDFWSTGVYPHHISIKYAMIHIYKYIYIYIYPHDIPTMWGPR